MLLLVVIEASLYFLISVFLSGKSPLVSATGETISESIASTGLAFPIALFLARHFGFAPPSFPLARASASGRSRRTRRHDGAGPGDDGRTHPGAQYYPNLSGEELDLVGHGSRRLDVHHHRARCRCLFRALRLSREAGAILPEEAQIVSLPRKIWSRGLLGATGVYALVCLGWVGVALRRKHHLVQEGVDPQREHEALLALNQGATHASKGDVGAAEIHSNGRSTFGRR